MNRRTHGEGALRCAATRAVEEMGMRVAVYCMKDCRHGHSKHPSSRSRQHKAILGDITITWRGEGVISKDAYDAIIQEQIERGAEDGGKWKRP